MAAKKRTSKSAPKRNYKLSAQAKKNLVEKMKIINKSAETLQKNNGYELRNVTTFERKTEKKMMPKLSRKEALKRAHKLYKG
ncbi:hypothetical protein [Hugenholtzia roseola]|uniref:hypothetical protein n=1 Tax=Hugenholtzia roseola TaxID=1002 RepID=UPI0003FA7933|nr:hypothetical protein [Hugenholtzia roseola]